MNKSLWKSFICVKDYYRKHMIKGRIGKGIPKIKKQLFFVSLLALLSACQSTTRIADMEVTAQSMVPSRYSSSNFAHDIVEGIDDDGLMPWGDFPIEELLPQIEMLFGENFELLAAFSRVESALAQAQIAGADRFPEFTASIGGSKNQQNFIGLPIPGNTGPLSTQFTSYNLTLASQWEIDFWGRLKNAKEASVLSLESVEADFKWLRHSLLSSYLQMWVNAHYADEFHELVSLMALNRQDLVRVTSQRYDSGLSNGDSLRSARVVLKNARTNEIQAEKNHRDALRKLESILGGYPNGQIELLGQLPQNLTPVRHGLPSDLLENRPDLVAAKKRLLAAGKRVNQSKASLFPRIALTSSAGTSSDQLSDLTDLDFSVWSLGGNVARPIFDYGKLKASLNISKANEKEVFARYLQSVQTAFSEVENALDNEKVLSESFLLAEQNLAESERLLFSAKQKYKLGVGTRIEVLENEYLLLQSRISRLDVFRQRLLNRILLTTSLGAQYRAKPDKNDVSDISS